MLLVDRKDLKAKGFVRESVHSSPGHLMDFKNNIKYKKELKKFLLKHQVKKISAFFRVGKKPISYLG